MLVWCGVYMMLIDGSQITKEQLSVCLSNSSISASNSRTKNCRNIKIALNVLQGGSNHSANFQFRSQRSRSPDVKNLPRMMHILDAYLLVAGGSMALLTAQ